jgi:hypothetical protein
MALQIGRESLEALSSDFSSAPTKAKPKTRKTAARAPAARKPAAKRPAPAARQRTSTVRKGAKKPK